MKEREVGLTKIGGQPTLKSEGNFMGESGEGPQPPEPIKPEAKLTLSPKDALELWERENKSRERAGEKISPQERQTQRLAAEMGIAPTTKGGEDQLPFNPDNFQNAQLRSIASRMQNFRPTAIELVLLRSRTQEIQGVIASGGLSEEDITAAEQMLTNLEALNLNLEQAMRERANKQRFGFYLQPEDIEILGNSQNNGPIKWLDNQFDILYRSVQEGQELTSPVIQNLQTVVSDAIRYLQYHSTPEKLDEFQTLFTRRLKLMTMRTYVGFRSIGEIKNAAMQLGARGLLSGFDMEDGKVTPMFNRLNELLDLERMKVKAAGSEFGHVTPEIANRLQDSVIQEQLRNASLGVGDFGDLRQGTIDNLAIPEGEDPVRFRQQYQEKIRADIVRAVRIAYDVFVDTQRLAVIVARGRHLSGTDAVFSDPASGPLNIYNIEDLLTEKFDIFNLHDYEFLERMKLDIAEGYIKEHKGLKLSDKEKLDLGTRLFRDLITPPDFFSSSWRIKGIVQSINERFIARFVDPNATGIERANQISDALNKAKDMALFLRLKGAGNEEPSWQVTKEDAWRRIATYRPDEIVRLFRERAPGTPELEGKLTALFNNAAFTANGITNYDQFKDKYGAILGLIRNKGYEDGRQIDVSQGFTDIEGEAINRYFGNNNEANNLIQMFTLMKQFSNESINDLMNNNKFEDIYTRTINVDDAMLGELEKSTFEYTDANGNRVRKTGFTPLSQKWAADQGGDALNRNWSDTENGVNAAKALVQFIKSEKEQERLKTAIECAEANSQYNGQMGRAKAIRYTYGTFLLTSKKDVAWEIIGLNKLPLRISMSDIERIYGPSGQPLSRSEIRQRIDEVSTLLVGSLKKEVRERTGNPQEYEKELKKELEKVKAFEDDLVVQSENTKTDFAKIKGLSLLLYILLAMLGEGQRVVREAGKGTLK